MARRRKMTVNDRIDLILQGNLSDLGIGVGVYHDHAISENDPQHVRLRQMSKLYNSSVEDKLLRTRLRCVTGSTSSSFTTPAASTSPKCKHFPLSPIQTQSQSHTSLVKPLELPSRHSSRAQTPVALGTVDEADSDSPLQTPVVFRASLPRSSFKMTPPTAGAAVVPEAYRNATAKTPPHPQSSGDGRSILMSPIKKHVNQEELHDYDGQEEDEEPLSSAASTSGIESGAMERVRRHRAHQRQRELGIHDDPDARPWYLTNSSHTPSLPVGSPEARIRRYGAFGTAKMMAKITTSGTAPLFQLHDKSQSLDNLKKNFEPVAYVPQLGGSPSLWPQDSNVTPGSKLQFQLVRNASPTRQTIDAVRFVGEKDQDILKLQLLDVQEISTLESQLAQEKQLRQQQIQQNSHEMHQWRQQMKQWHHLDHAFHKLDNKKSAKSMTIIYTPSFEINCQDQSEIEAKRSQQFELKWQNFAFLLEAMKRTTCRRPVIQDLEKLYALSWELVCGAHHHHRTGAFMTFGLSRLQFWTLFSNEYPSLEFCHAMRLFSSFDPTFQDQMDFRLFIATLRALRVQKGTPLEILVFGLKDLDVSKHNVVTREHFEMVMTMCCGTHEELANVQRQVSAFWQSFFGDTHDPTSLEQIIKALEQESGLLQEFTRQLLARRSECLSGGS